jgi:hypothetical protein
MTQESLLTRELLLERVHERVSKQRLPAGVPRSILVSRAAEAACAVCDRKIPDSDPAYELEFETEQSVRRVHLHHRCYLVWESEYVEREAAAVRTGDSAPSNDGKRD